MTNSTETDNEAAKAEAKADENYYSTVLSETSRFVGFGLLATFFAFRVGESAIAAPWVVVTAIGALGVLAVFLDYLQYLFGYLRARSAYKDALKIKHKVKTDDWYSASTLAFRGKQIAALAGSAALLVAVMWPETSEPKSALPSASAASLSCQSCVASD